MVTLETMISDLIKEDPRAIDVLASLGMRCVGCGSVEAENFEMACKSHGLDPVLAMRKMNIMLYGKLA